MSVFQYTPLSVFQYTPANFAGFKLTTTTTRDPSQTRGACPSQCTALNQRRPRKENVIWFHLKWRGTNERHLLCFAIADING